MPSDPARPQRLHPSSILFAPATAIKNMLFPIVLLWVFSRGGGYEVWYLLGLIPVLVGYTVKYISYRYRFGSEELIIKEGILTRNERHIPYARIQNIDLTRNPFHRALGVAEARIETASGGKPEAVIRVLSMSAIEVMRERVFGSVPREAAGTEGAPAAVAGESVAAREAGQADVAETLVELPLKEIVIFGLISNRGLVVVAAAFGLASQAGLFDQDWEELVRRYLPRLEGISFDLVHVKVTMILLVGSAVVIGGVVLMRILSVVLAILKLHGFRLTRRVQGLRAEYGLLTRITSTIPAHRIQLLSTRESRLHRWFGRASVQVETAGGARGGGDSDGESSGATERQWLAPVIRKAEVEGLVRRVQPEVDLGALDWLPLEQRAWRRIVKRGLIVVGIVSVPALIFAKFWGLLTLLAVPPLWYHARRWIAETGYALTPHAIVFRSGWWGRRLSVVVFNKIQAVDWRQTPFDRRNRMASVSVDTAGAGRTGHRIDIPFLDESAARRMQEQLAELAGKTAFRW